MARARTVWEEGSDPARLVVLWGVAVALTLLLLDLSLTGGVGWFFDVGFVVLAVALALRVRPGEFLNLAAFPPALLAGVLLVAALFHHDGNTVQAWVTLLAEHVTALVVAYLLFLACLWVRQRFVDRRDREPSA